ncbi:AglZ/HisF2 family acetamidino modification protein [Gracilinema caldarium]|uniref:imidazole glycerol-phosphate synthase n=1 Tax=Gracilinema caldarium (strain ATCC 51460 / DSM 7334 / H1) TaxID=744872 RepID=F8F032_GRAC1|nr:AglZ/HisF2 family acetamidino modification protein [Gracilinema caldarium]AEJ18685.1 histidine biosynthesis protein [Gracilinema caldarium DSM 7334]
MLLPRVIPCLLVHEKGLVKSVRFKDYKYVGDPINAVKIFNEKKVDELMVIDIDATVENYVPDMRMIKNLANECRMPLCYGGGIKTVEQAGSIINLGVEKVAISSAAIENPDLIMQISRELGSQSVVVVLDVKKKLYGKYEIYIHNGKKATGLELFDYLKVIIEKGAGEIVINSIDNDGMMKGYDLKLAQAVYNAVSIPLIILGGCGSLEDIKKLFNVTGTIGAAAGSLFVFKGPHKAVLINYPNRQEKESLFLS